MLGGRRVHPREVDLPWCGAILRQNGVVEETGLAAGVQGHPAIGVAWLASKLAPWGECLQAGEIVLAGSFTRPVPAQKGDRSTPTTARSAASSSVSPEPCCPCKHPSTPSSRPSPPSARRSACGSAWPTPTRAEICAGAGFDWLLIDGEHAPNDLRSILQQVQVIAGYPARTPSRACPWATARSARR